MPAAQYPFIDIAVHRSVRDRLAGGEALVLFSTDMRNVLWANGPGALFFGRSSIYELIEEGVKTGDLAFRQIAASASLIRSVGESRSLVVRVPSGFRSVTVGAMLEMVELRPGEPSILLAVPAANDVRTPRDVAERLLSGLDDPDTHMAVLDAEGRAIVTSSGFSGLGITPHTTLNLATMVAHESSRLMKRPIPTGLGYLPAAIGRISDEPALNLLFVVEAAVDLPAPIEAQAEETATPFEDAPEAEARAAQVETPAEEIVTQGAGPAEEPTPPVEESQPVQPEAAPHAVTEPATAPAPEAQAAEGDLPFVFDRGGRATRFVWKIDAEGRFSEVSSEFADAVGPRAAAINGVAFEDVAARFKLDPDGKIGELLKRRDTWSGKTILWPVEGTGLRVPVDLAALPTYSRNRDFDGFRGFGVVRIADAVEDPDETGRVIAGETSATEAMAAPSVEPETPESTTPHAPEEGSAEDAAADTGAGGLPLPPRLAAEEDDGFLVPSHPQEETSVPAPPAPGDEPRREPPALYIARPAIRPQSDKIIQLEEHRARGRDGLTPGEEAAFREIARKLDPEGLRFVARQAGQEEAALAGEKTDRQPQGAAMPAPPAATTPAPPAPPQELPRATSPFLSVLGRREIGLSADIVDLMPVALLVHVGERLIHANPEFLKLTGYEDLKALETAGGIDALLQRQDLDNVPDEASRIVVVRADDTLVPVSARLQSVRWDQSSALLLSLVPTETKEPAADPQQTAEAEKAAAQLAKLKVEVDELHSILETATDGVVLLGADGDIRSMNRSASALFNYEGDEVRGKPFVMLFAHESQRAILDYLQGLSGHGVASVLNDGREVIGREASGGFLPLFMTIGKLTSSNGFCAVIRDITQWKRTEEELRNAKRAAETANAHKSEFLARVSHEIRTPLNAIIGFADIMANEHFGPVGHARYSEYAGDIVRSGRHVLDIVNDLLDISKIEAGEMDLDFTAVGLNETVSQAVAIIQPQANSQRVIIRTALSQAVPSVVADLRSIKQIVLNILANAIRFTPSGGQIIVSTAYEPNGSVVLRIRDTGIGMTRAELDQAMKPFRQVATGMQARGDGTGLGLPLTKAMVDANRALFSIQSAPNEGTLVEVTFPSQRVLAD